MPSVEPSAAEARALKTTGRFQFNRQVLESVVGGVSTIDTKLLSITSEDEGRLFLQAYGYDVDIAEQNEQLWATHRRAVSLIREHLLDAGEEVPPELADQQRLDISPFVADPQMQR